jgi:hypothetical protein
MKKLLLFALISGAFLIPSIVRAQQFNLPQITGTLSVSTGTITYSTPTVTNAMNCISHLTATCSSVATLTYLSLGTTYYQVTLSSSVPFDTQWAHGAALCSPAGQQSIMQITGNTGSYLMSVDEFLTKGWSP